MKGIGKELRSHVPFTMVGAGTGIVIMGIVTYYQAPRDVSPGITIACRWPRTRFPHAGHVLLSTWASLFHISMALHETPDAAAMALIGFFLFLAVWIPCCTSDIVFPLLFAKEDRPRVPHGVAYDPSH